MNVCVVGDVSGVAFKRNAMQVARQCVWILHPLFNASVIAPVFDDEIAVVFVTRREEMAKRFFECAATFELIKGKHYVKTVERLKTLLDKATFVEADGGPPELMLGEEGVHFCLLDS